MGASRGFSTRLTGALSWIGSAAGVGVLWIAFSLPIVTMFASTAALLTVVRRWMDGDQPAVLATFREAFGAHVKRAVAIQLLWMVLLGLAWAYVSFAAAIPNPTMRIVVLTITMLMLLVGGATAAFAVPVLVDHPDTVRGVLRNSALLAAANPGHALLAMLVVLATVIACIAVIPASPVTGVGGCYLVYRLCRRAIRRTSAKAERLGLTSASDEPAVPTTQPEAR